MYLSAVTLVSRMGAHVVRELCTRLPDDPLDPVSTDAEAMAAALSVDSGATPVGAYVMEIAGHLSDAVRWAEGRVESEVAQRYSLPLVGADALPPREIEEATFSLARYNLYSRRDYRIPESVQMDKDDAISWLRRVGRGEAALNLSGAGAAQAQAAVYASGAASTDLLWTQPMP